MVRDVFRRRGNALSCPNGIINEDPFMGALAVDRGFWYGKSQTPLFEEDSPARDFRTKERRRRKGIFRPTSVLKNAVNGHISLGDLSRCVSRIFSRTRRS